MIISGSGQVAAGEYNEKISIGGSGRINGNVRCVGVSCSGSMRSVGNLECSENVSVSGSAHFEKSITADNVSVSGSVRIDEDVKAKGSVKISGSVKIGGSVKCSLLSCSGSVDIGGEGEAEEIRVSGRINCVGLLNAEKVTVRLDGFNITSRIGSIGGGEIMISNDRKGERISRLPLLKRLVGNGGTVCVDELIEGDVVAIESVKSPKVVGRVVAIGADCEIDLVQYSEEIEIDPNAKVGKYEKV